MQDWEEVGDIRRHLIGLLGILLLCSGLVLTLARPSWEGMESFRAAALRLGPFLVVIWLGFPQLQRLPSWLFWTFPVLLLVLAFRPRWFLVLLPLLLALVIINPYRSRSGRTIR